MKQLSRRSLLSISCALALVCSMNGSAVTPTPDEATLSVASAEIDRLFRDFAAGNHVPGAAWGIVIDGSLAHAGAAGFRERASKAPADADTVFRIASMTKSFTAMSILKLRDEGR